MSEDERLREIAWKRTRRGLRWNMLRDMIAIVSLRWMTVSQVQDTMTALNGITHGKTLQFLAELERPGFVKQERDDKDKFYKWGSTPKGAKFWLPGGTPASIPVRIVKAVSTIENV